MLLTTGFLEKSHDSTPGITKSYGYGIAAERDMKRKTQGKSAVQNGKDAAKKRYFAVAEQLMTAQDGKETRKLKKKLARMTFPKGT